MMNDESQTSVNLDLDEFRQAVEAAVSKQMAGVVQKEDLSQFVTVEKMYVAMLTITALSVGFVTWSVDRQLDNHVEVVAERVERDLATSIGTDVSAAVQTEISTAFQSEISPAIVAATAPITNQLQEFQLAQEELQADIREITIALGQPPRLDGEILPSGPFDPVFPIFPDRSPFILDPDQTSRPPDNGLNPMPFEPQFEFVPR